jgi:replicative DNA helicase
MTVRPPGVSAPLGVARSEATPPQNLEAEASVLGAIMLSLEAMERVADILKAEYFYQPRNAAVFRAAVELHRRGEPVDILTVDAELRRMGLLERAGGTEYLASLESGVAIPAHVENYARIVEEAAVRRGLLAAATRIHELGHNLGLDVDAALDAAETEIMNLAHERTTQDAIPIATALKDTWDRIERLHENPDEAPGVRTGFYKLDEMTGGLQPGTLCILAARPSVGKTSLALNIAQHAAQKERVPVAVFSLEMSRWELTHRLLSGEANVDAAQLKTGKLSDTDWQRIANAMGVLSEAPMFIDDRPGATVLEMRSKARRLKVRHDIGLVVIDYIQLMYGSGRSENRTQEVSEISRALKRLAVELDIPVLALSQLSRASEQRADHRPQLADLRESGSIEQDSDLVLFIYREGLYNPEVKRNQTELMVAKHRSGATGNVDLLFLESQTRFVNVTRQSPAGPQG